MSTLSQYSSHHKAITNNQLNQNQSMTHLHRRTSSRLSKWSVNFVMRNMHQVRINTVF
jgi:hypothetical protein